MRHPPPESPTGDMAAEHARLALEAERLRLECKGLRHDNAVVSRERDSLLQENIAIRQAAPTRQREDDLRQREDRVGQREEAMGRRASANLEDLLALGRQLETSESHLRLAQARILSLETQVSILRLELLDATHSASGSGAMVPKREIARQLRELLQLCHPDKWQNAAVATELTKEVNALRAQYLE